MFGKTAPGTHLGGSRWSAASPISEETKIQISLALKGPNGPLSGVPRSPETIKLMRANHPHAKRVYQYDLDRLTLIWRFDSIRQAAELTKCSIGYRKRCIKQNKAAHGNFSSL